ncbi:MAG: VOC family protein [Myxococcota bacterium]
MGNVVYFELPTGDAPAAQAFWGGLFGWQFEPGNFPGYHMIPNAGPLAGMDSSQGPSPIRVFFGVENIESSAAKVRELGGEAGEAIELPSGWLVRCSDPQGVEFTLWKNKGA